MFFKVIKEFRDACRETESPDKNYVRWSRGRVNLKMSAWVQNMETWIRTGSLFWIRTGSRLVRRELTPKRRKAITLIIMRWLAQDGQLLETETDLNHLDSHSGPDHDSSPDHLLFANNSQRRGESLARFLSNLHETLCPRHHVAALDDYPCHVEWRDLRPLLDAWATPTVPQSVPQWAQSVSANSNSNSGIPKP
jgi:hypothetical protein